MNKKFLINKLKEKSLLWSYEKFSKITDKVLIETTLKYLDVDDILMLFKIYNKDLILKIWKENIYNDIRFKKLNFYLERVIFDISSNSVKEGTRFDKLKSLIS